MLKYFNLIVAILLFIWISFFPAPIQEKYHLFTNILLMLVFIILWVRKRNLIFKLSDYPFWIFLLAISINVFFAQQRTVALKTYLDLAVPMFCVYYLLSEVLFSEKNFNLLAKVICVASILVSWGGILEFLFAHNPLYAQVIPNSYYLRYITGFVRPMSTQFNPVALGSYLLGCLPFSFLLFKQERSLFRLLGALSVASSVVVIILTFSRGVFLGLISMVIFYFFMQRKKRAMFIFFIILSVFILLCSFLPQPFNRFGKYQMTTEHKGLFSNYRFTRCMMAQRMLEDYPLTGLGFQHFRSRFYEYYPYQFKVTYEFMIADNMYLTILAETGIIGILGFLIFILSFLSRGCKKLGILKFKLTERAQLLAALTAFVGLLVNMGAYELFYWPNQYLLFCIVTGCLASRVKLSKAPGDPSKARRSGRGEKRQGAAYPPGD